MKIVYNSFDGRWSDSPKALAPALEEALVARGEHVEHTWIASPVHESTFPAGTVTVPADGPECIAALEAADLVVSNTHLRPQWHKKPGAVYLQTWHGTPLKHIASDEPGVPDGAPVPGHLDIARWDVLLSPNIASADRLAGAFAFTGRVATTGYPRNDALLAPGAEQVRARVRSDLGLHPGDHAVLYTPTWRDDVRDKDGNCDVDLRLDLRGAAAALAGSEGADGAPRTVLLLRLHYMVSGQLGPLDIPGVIDVSAHPDVTELYLAADAMITDYSSTMFDFAVTGKPLAFFVYDLEHYRDDLRGFYVDLETVAPGPLLRTSTEVVDALAALAADPVGARAPYADRYAAFAREFCHAEDGQATQRVLDLLLPLLGRDGGVHATETRQGDDAAVSRHGVGRQSGGRQFDGAGVAG